VVEDSGRAQVITTGTNKVRSYDLASGEVIWEGPGLTLNAIPSPLESDGVVYLTSGFRGSVAYAVRLKDARGDIASSPAILWRRDRDTPYVTSPLLYDGVFYLVKSNSGILTALDAKTGEALYGPERLDPIAEIYASPVAAAGRVYLLGRDGNALVLASGRKLEVLAKSSLEDGFDASPVLTGKEMYLRGYRYLYRIEAE
jgi:outer membrane protein assembly factor BamB